ncbi:MAG: NfeD family protein [Gammaproteobacteria bacterium]|nr:NfeD family protein [Gammaproteobacteria bacterium]
MMEFLTTWTHWHWWTVAAVLILLEMAAPGIFFLWLGLAAVVVGALALVAPGLGIEIQGLLFAVLSVAAVVVGRMYWKRTQEGPTDQPFLNRRGSQYVDRVFHLKAPIVDGVGKLNADDTTWKVRGPDVDAGTRVRVTRVDGTWLVVEPAGEKPSA